MNREKARRQRQRRRRTGIRKRIYGRPDRPRLSVYRSSKHMYAQLIDDFSGRTLASANTLQQKLDKPSTVDAAKEVGKTMAERAKSAGIETVTFDRNGFRYHGRVAHLADAAREGGLKF